MTKFAPKTQWQEFILSFKRNFVSEEREKMQNAMKYSVASFCITDNASKIRENHEHN